MNILSTLLLFSLSFFCFASNSDKANRLISESSPYLLQHAYNPVNWYPWGEEAFAKARKENKPLFISIGYSTCHWCHVMAHESFENDKIAKILNDHFISIKVDREERPDIDRIYITAAEILAGYGGWPTTIVANTELKPFFANTYIPPFAKDGRKGLEDILNSVVLLWQEDKAKIDTVANEVTDLIRKQLQSQTTKGTVNKSSIKKAYLEFEAGFDTEHGGFGNAPKFPRTSAFDFLLQYNTGKSKQMVSTSLSHILRGGIYDQVDGGFHRYSVDAQWKVPHFEKMLYDQGLIINTLIDAGNAIQSTQYYPAITQSLNFAIKQMRSDKGGFYSAYDADSTRPDKPKEHGEGAYYVWKKSELDSLLNPAEKKLFYPHFNIQATGNVDSDPQKEFTGLNILHAENTLQYSAKEISMPFADAKKILTSSLHKLKQQRIKRPLPHLDDKVITAWNALMIKALAKASTQLKNNHYKNIAEDAARFIHAHLYNPKTKQLYRSYREGKRSGEAYLDDYAYLTNALLSLYKSTNNKQWLIWANDLMQQQITLFYDNENSGFFDNTANDKNILIRSKEIYDGSLPSANAITVENLALLSNLMKKKKWKDIARKTVNAFHNNMNELYSNYPQMFKSLLILDQ